MLVTKYFLIGNLSISSAWVALLLAFILAYIGIRLKFGKRLAELLSDAIFYFVIVWKLSVVITDFETVIRAPLSILYFHGGSIGVFLGLVAAAIKILVEVRKQQLTKTDLISLFIGGVLIQSIYQLFMVVLNDGEVIASIVTIVIFLAFLILVWFSMNKMDELGTGFAMLFIVVHLFVSSFQKAGILSVPVIATVFIGIYFAMLLFGENFKKLYAEGTR